MKSFRDYLGLSNSCLYDVDDVIGRVDRFGFQNFCSPGSDVMPRSFWPMSWNRSIAYHQKYLKKAFYA